MTVRPIIPLPIDSMRSVEEKLKAIQAALDRQGLSLAQAPQAIPGIHKALGFSDFIAKTCTRDPGILVDLVKSRDLETAYEAGEYRRRLGLLEPVRGDDPLTELQLQLMRCR